MWAKGEMAVQNGPQVSDLEYDAIKQMRDTEGRAHLKGMQGPNLGWNTSEAIQQVLDMFV